MTFDPVTRSEIAHRSAGNCEAALNGCTGHASHVHHRQLRRWGDHTAPNGLHVCAGCHHRIHTMGEPAYTLGLLVHGWADPANIPVRRGA